MGTLAIVIQFTSINNSHTIYIMLQTYNVMKLVKELVRDGVTAVHTHPVNVRVKLPVDLQYLSFYPNRPYYEFHTRTFGDLFVTIK